MLPDDPNEKTDWKCECGDWNCKLKVWMTLDEYGEIMDRNNPKVYIRSNDCTDKSGIVVETREGYVLYRDEK